MMNVPFSLFSPRSPKAELEALRRSVVRRAPFGDEEWQRVTAEQLDLGFTLRPSGRPSKAENDLDDGTVQLELVR